MYLQIIFIFTFFSLFPLSKKLFININGEERSVHFFINLKKYSKIATKKNVMDVVGSYAVLPMERLNKKMKHASMHSDSLKKIYKKN